MSAIKAKISIAIDADLLKRIDRLAAVTRSNRSRWIEDHIRDAIDQEELAVKVFSDPALGTHMAKMFGNPEFIRGMTRILREDLSDEQLKLFTDKLAGVMVQKEEPAVVQKMKERKRGKKR